MPGKPQTLPVDDATGSDEGSRASGATTGTSTTGNARRTGHRDPDYERSVFGWHAQGKEALGLVAVALMHLPLLPIAPFFTLAVEWSALRYYRVHKRAHCDPEWAREHLPWHYDHHMGPNQDANWCVSWPWFDWVMGTREPFVGTERERRRFEQNGNPATTNR
jgi:hypothetical protein